MNRLAIETASLARNGGDRDFRLAHDRRLRERRRIESDYAEACQRSETNRRIRARRAIESAMAAKLDSDVTDWQARFYAARQAVEN
jgi:hypothetical protein